MADGIFRVIINHWNDLFYFDCNLTCENILLTPEFMTEGVNLLLRQLKCDIAAESFK